jgi:hypothetical protein
MVINPTDFDDALLVRMRDRIYQEMRREYLTRHTPEELPFREQAKKNFLNIGMEHGRTAHEIHDRILHERSLNTRGINLQGMLNQLKSASSNIKRAAMEKLSSTVKTIALAGINEISSLLIGTLQREGFELCLVCDNNTALHGNRYCGVRIGDYDELSACRPDAVIITSLSHSFTIRQQIEGVVGEEWGCAVYDLYEFLS